MEKKHLKITQKGFAHYTGPVSVYEFVDGVSVEAIPQHERDRIAASMACVEIAENGKETVAGVAERLVAESAARAPAREKLQRQSVEDKIEEERRLAEAAVGTVKRIYTEAELDQVIKQGGIAALREVAATWKVKHRSIPTLRQMILDAQDEYVANHNRRIEFNKTAVEEVVRRTTEDNAPAKARESVPETLDDAPGDDTREDDADAALEAAAASGDMSAAINDDTDDETGTDADEKAG